MVAPSPKHGAIKVMVVDDSAVIRGLISRALEEDPEIEVISSASNGHMAISGVKRQSVDVMVLDIEMPEMDGITALPQILAASPATKVIMASVQTQRQAEASMRALTLGAADYIPKPTTKEDTSAAEEFYRGLKEKVKILGRPLVAKAEASSKPAPINAAPLKLPMLPVKALAIASSTGGPQALLTVLGGLKGKLPNIPIFITQHMPPNFTAILADHIGTASDKPSREGKDGEIVKAGEVYLAPGNYHMVAAKNAAGEVVLHTNQDPPENFCRPAADPMLRSLVPIYGKHLLVAVLTGMGQDGLEGAKLAAKAGATIIAQDEASCVVWGMPRAIADNNLASAILPLGQVADYIIKAGNIR